MSKDTFRQLAVVIFFVVAVVHALRVAFKWELIVAGWQVPVWVSVVAVVVAAYLSYEGYRAGKSNS
jgi:hypothetical protein